MSRFLLNRRNPGVRLFLLVLGFVALVHLSGCGDSSGGGSSGPRYSLSGYDGIDSDGTNPYDLYTEFPWFVHSTFQVADSDGVGVPGLTASDFVITEDGTRLDAGNTSMFVLKRNRLPAGFTYSMDTVLLLDNTPQTTAGIDMIKEAAQAIIENMEPMNQQQRVAIMAFDENGEPYVKQGFTSDRQILLGNLLTGEAATGDSLQPTYKAADIYNGVKKGLSLWEDDHSPDSNSFRQGFLVLVTDGKDIFNFNSENINAIRGQKRVYTVAVNSDQISDSVKSKLSSLGNAGYFPVPEPSRRADEGFDDNENLRETLAEIQQRMLLHADSFYWLQYKSLCTSTDASLDHTVLVSVAGNENDGEDSRVECTFNSSEFFTGIPGIYVNASGTDPDGIDEYIIEIAPGEVARMEILDAVIYTTEAANVSDFDWVSSDIDERVFTIEPNPAYSSSCTLTVVGPGEAVLTISDSSNAYPPKVIRVVVCLRADSYVMIPYVIDSSPPWFVDATFQVRRYVAPEDIEETSNQWEWVTDLVWEDFTVVENGVPADVNYPEISIRKRDNLPSEFSYAMKTVLLIDNTPSINSNLVYMKEAAKAFVDRALIGDADVAPMLDPAGNPQQEIAVWTFTEEGDSIDPWFEFSSDPAKLKAAIDSIPKGFGPTDFYGGMIDALSMWKNDQAPWDGNTTLQQGVVVALTDGYHSLSGSYTAEAVLDCIGDRQVITVGVGDDLVSKVNSELKLFGNAGFYSVPDAGKPVVVGQTETGEDITEPALVNELKNIQTEIVDYANSFYWLEYKSDAVPAADCAITDSVEVHISSNENTEANAFVAGQFETCEFFLPETNAIYFNRTTTHPEGIDGPIDFKFITNPMFGDPRFRLEASTYEYSVLPSYEWSVISGSNILVEPDDMSYANSKATVMMNPDNRAEGLATVGVYDTSNSSSKSIDFNVQRISLPEPVAYYPFNGTALDLSANAYNGTVSGAVLDADRFREPASAYLFDGSADGIALSMIYGGVDGEVMGDLTVNAWIKTDSSANMRIVSFDYRSYWELFMSEGKITLASLPFGTADAIKTVNTYNDNRWHMITGTINVADGTMQLFVDGAPAVTTTQVITAELIPQPQYGFIGCRDNRQSLSFNGLIDDVAIFDSVLTIDQIQALYQAE